MYDIDRGEQILYFGESGATSGNGILSQKGHFIFMITSKTSVKIITYVHLLLAHDTQHSTSYLSRIHKPELSQLKTPTLLATDQIFLRDIKPNYLKHYCRIQHFTMAEQSLPPVKPFPPLPDRKEYEHLSEKDKMLQQFPHRPLEKGLSAERVRCRGFVQRYNQTSFDDEKTRRAILDELLHPDSKGKNIFIEPTFRVDYGYNLKVGNNFYANFDCCFLDSCLIEFGDDCMLAPAVHFYAATHPINGAFRKLTEPENYFELAAPIKVGNNCWFGGGSIILPGVTLGDNVVVGAGAVVTKSFPSNVVIGGNPARVIRHMPPPEPLAEPLWKTPLE